MKSLLFLLIFLGCVLCKQGLAQQNIRVDEYENKRKIPSDIDHIYFRNIGPGIMGGRVVDMEVNPDNPNEFYVAYASGGIWHTDNNAQSFVPVFDHEATLTIGDMAVNWKDHILWVGTGEVNSSRSSYAGTGMYKSMDRGQTWEYIGLPESHHIGKIELDPNNKNIAWVAVLGHLYTYHPERGIFKTVNGGKDWKNVLYINDSTGCVDLLLDAQNTKILYATSWTRSRKAWHFNESGTGSAIFKSTDAGEHWTKITSGFPQGEKVGRIGIAQCKSQPHILYALLDNNFRQDEKDPNKTSDAALDDRIFSHISTKDFLNLDDKKLEEYLRKYDFPEKYSAKSVKKDIQNNRYTPVEIVQWKNGDANANLFETPIIGAEVYKSDDYGHSWKKTNIDLLNGVYFTYGYYFGTINVSPQNPDKVWIGGYPLLLSSDGGKHFEQKDGENCHPDYHRIWINPKNEKHLIVGNDGGLNITYDEGKVWFKANSPAVGQFYAIETDDAKPYNVYGGLQDNGTWWGSSRHQENNAWHETGRYAYRRVGGGDGMQVQIDRRDNETVYSGFQFGYYSRSDKNKGGYLGIHPHHDIGEKAYRFNWQSPIRLSRHNQDILYFGSNCFHRSMNKGADMECLSKDLTSSPKRGNVPYGTLTTISESPVRFGTLYCGTDDGNVWLSKDVGYEWQKINPLPEGLWVSRVQASRYKAGRVYVSFSGYRNDDFNPYLFVSEDYGLHWKNIGSNLPHEPVNTIVEDPKVEEVVYVGTDNGIYVSFDAGNHFIPWRGNLPRVAIHDIAIQERENEIVLGTHGRSIYIASLDLIQKYSKWKEKKLFINDLPEVTYNENQGKKFLSYSEPVLQKVTIQYYVPQKENIKIIILDQNFKVLRTNEIEAQKGWNEYEYDLSMDKDMASKKGIEVSDDGNYYLTVGDYTLRIIDQKAQYIDKRLTLSAK